MISYLKFKYLSGQLMNYNSLHLILDFFLLIIRENVNSKIIALNFIMSIL